MVERQIGLHITPLVEDNPEEGGSPHTMQMQNPVPAEILNGNSPGGERPFRKTPLMKKIEGLHDGAPIEGILYDLYWRQQNSTRQTGKVLGGLSGPTIAKWIVGLGEEIRSAKDGMLASYAQGQRRKILAVNFSPTKNKLMEVKETFEIDSEERIKAFLRTMYKKYHSLEAMAEAFGEKGINVRSPTVRKWMLQFELDLNVLREKDDRNLVRRSVESGEFEKLTPSQKEVLRKTWVF